MAALFKKPSNMKYTDMCIFIDNNVYRDDLTEEEENLIFEYLYHIIKMLAYKAKYFNKAEYYEDFAVYLATDMYFRLKNPKQFQFDEETGEWKLTKIKSCLNYIKHIISGRKKEFTDQIFSQIYTQAPDEENPPVYDMNYSFGDKLSEALEEINLVDFDLCLGNICATTKNFLKQIPYKSNPKVWYNIYLSCILTLLNNLTLSNKTKERIANLKYDIKNRPHAVDNLFLGSSESTVILYHLNKSMQDYIWILVQEIKHLMAKDLSLTLHTQVPLPSAVNAIALADINLEEYMGYND